MINVLLAGGAWAPFELVSLLLQLVAWVQVTAIFGLEASQGYAPISGSRNGDVTRVAIGWVLLAAG